MRGTQRHFFKMTQGFSKFFPEVNPPFADAGFPGRAARYQALPFFIFFCAQPLF